MKYIIINKNTGRIIAFDNQSEFQAFCYNHHHLTGVNLETSTDDFKIRVVASYEQIGKEV